MFKSHLVTCLLLPFTASATAFSPTFIIAANATDRMTVYGLALPSAALSILLQSGTTCTPVGGVGHNVTIDYVAPDQSWVSFPIGGAGLPIGTYSVCLSMGPGSVFIKVSFNNFYVR